MKQLLNDFIGAYNPIQVTDTLSLDIPFIMACILTIVVCYALIRGVISLCRRG